MNDAPRRLVLLQGGRKAGAGGPGGRLPRAALRLIPGGPAGGIQAAIEETILAARRMRREIEERIARALEDVPR